MARSDQAAWRPTQFRGLPTNSFLPRGTHTKHKIEELKRRLLVARWSSMSEISAETAWGCPVPNGPGELNVWDSTPSQLLSCLEVWPHLRDTAGAPCNWISCKVSESGLN